MRIGLYRGDAASGPIDKILDAARDAAAAGYTSFWLPQTMGMDAMAVLAVVGREVPGIDLGTAVVPTYPRHPVVMAQQALTAQSISGGRFILGIGLSHQPLIEGSFGYSFEKPIRHMREYLDALLPLVREGSVQVAGETITARATLDVRGSSPVQVLLAALGPQMLQLAGARADGTVTWMCGPSTLEQHVVPTITAAASEAGREAPVIGAGFPVCVTDDPDGARDGDFAIEVKGSPVKVWGEMRIEPTADGGTHHTVDGKLEVKVPLIGGKVASWAEGPSQQRLDGEYTFHRERLST